ncbi:Rid family detoxifying hydrolase [Lentisphaerota bacterium ZTH]|nr:hypothetical protein JYG24_04310 [Lentisphaerota bacterium]WET07269.1 Rid family detoxifying hydrolase [Lentisphaerota bacterium ZTH]
MQPINSEKLPVLGGPFVPAIKENGMIFTSGQLGLDTEGTMAEGVDGQSRQVLENLKNLLEAGGSSLNKVVKTTCFLADIKDYAEFNAVYAEYFGDHKPARSCFQVGALPLGALVEIECIASC